MKYGEWKIPYGKTRVPPELLSAGFSPLLAAVLESRGLGIAEEAKTFLYGEPGLFANPMLLTGMGEAVARITRAIRGDEKTAIYGDYDVDGITSACLLADYLGTKGLNCEVYIPDRIEEGYGLNKGAIDLLHAKGVQLIITVDCGVTALEEALHARSLGIDMIITDHHECRESLPEAVAVINPKRPDCDYPGRDLAGVGVAFKLACAMEDDLERMLDRYCDLVAVGTIADVMPMTGENRQMIRAGLKKISESPRPGIAALLQEAGVADKKLSSVTIGYTLAPRINAAGRLGRVDVAVRLLLAQTQGEARDCAAELCKMNRDRQGLEQLIWEQAREQLGGAEQNTPIVLAGEDWHQGVIGIAASRITEEFKVPAVVICLTGDQGKGSCRSFGDFNLFAALNACSEHLQGFGGHAFAAGLSISRDKVDDFRDALGEYYLKNPPEKLYRLEPDLRIDVPALLDMECVESLALLEPCGNGNPRPLLCITDALIESVIPIGGGRHLKLHVSKFGRSYECVFFSRTPEALGAEAGDYVDLAFYPQVNEFRSRKTIQLVLTELRRFDAQRLSDRIYEGDVSPDEANELLPERSEFAKLWRGAQARGGRVAGTISGLMRSVGLSLTPGKLFVCLAVFSELGLMEVSDENGQLEISQNASAQKADLNSSELLRRVVNIVNIKE